MANKKPSKSVLDYDPLAWLGDGDDDTEDLDKVESNVVINKNAEKKAAVKKAASKKKSVKKQSSKKTVVKKSATKKAVATQTETTEMSGEMSDANEESSGYGFFGNHDPIENKTANFVAESNSESDEGYGFFEPSEQLSSQSVELDSSTNVISLGAELTIRSVSACKALIEGNISNGFDVKLAAGELQKIDTAGLQLIYSLNHTLEKTSQSINWVSSNSIINDAAQLIGMPKLLESSDDEGAFGFFNETEKTEPQGSQQDDSSYGLF